MKRYIRTKDGRIVDVEKFINEKKENPYYSDYEFEEIKNEEDRCSIRWTAIGTKENSIKDQVGRRCQFSGIIYSPFIKQSDAIEDLLDGGHINHKILPNPSQLFNYIDCAKTALATNVKLTDIYGCIWRGNDFVSVARLNKEGEWELI